MGSDLIALVFALSLGTAVVVLGLRRNLSETTRNGLPQFGDPEQTTATLGLYEGGERRRRPLSPRRRRQLASFYLLIAFINAAFAILSADSRLFHAGAAGLWALPALVLLWQAFSNRSDGSVS